MRGVNDNYEFSYLHNPKLKSIVVQQTYFSFLSMIFDHQKINFKEKCLIEKVTVKAPFRFSVDFPDEACFIYFEEGNSKINSPYDQVKISPQESVLLKCGTYFSDLRVELEFDAYKIIVVHLPKNILKEIYVHEFPPVLNLRSTSNSIRKIESQELVGQFIKSLNFYFENPQLVSDELLSLKIKELILLLVNTENLDTLSTLFQQLFTPQEIDLREVVKQHLFSEISVNDLAFLCHMSISTFKRQFKHVFNDTPANYFKTKRLEKAKELLILSKLSISEIAYETGFADVGHFSKSFKSLYMSTPSEYRLNQ